MSGSVSRLSQCVQGVKTMGRVLYAIGEKVVTVDRSQQFPSLTREAELKARDRIVTLEGMQAVIGALFVLYKMYSTELHPGTGDLVVMSAAAAFSLLACKELILQGLVRDRLKRENGFRGETPEISYTKEDIRQDLHALVDRVFGSSAAGVAPIGEGQFEAI